MATLVWCEGFEAGAFDSASLPSGDGPLYSLGASLTSLTSVTGRTHGKAVRIPQDGTSGSFNVGRALETGSTVFVCSLYFKIVTLNTTGDANYLVCATASSNGFASITSGGNARVAIGGTTQTSSGTYNDSAWHRLDFRFTKGTTSTIDWAIDGTAQTQCSASDTADNVTGWRVGSTVTADDLTVDIDDLVISQTSGDYPLGEYEVWGLRPNADGTHAGGSGGIDNSDGTGLGTTAYQYLDDDPWTTAATGTWLLQASNDGTDYAEIAFANDAQGVTPEIVKGQVGISSAGTATNNAIYRFVDASGNTLKDVVSGDVSVTDLRFGANILASPGGDGWTTTELDGVKFRFGFSTDANPDPECHLAMLEYAIPISGSSPQTVSPGLIDVSGSVFAPSSINQNVTVGLIDNSASIFAPTQVSQSVAIGLIDQTAVIYAPTSVTPGPVTVGPMDLLDASGQVFDPQINLLQSLGLIDQSGTVFAPASINQSVVLGLIDQSGVVYAPTVTTSGAPQTITDPALLQAVGTLFDIQVNQAANIGLIDQSGTVFAPASIDQYVAVGLIDQSAVVYDMQANQYVVVDLIDNTAQVFTPQVNLVVSVSLIDNSGQVFTPDVSGGILAEPEGNGYWWF